MIGRRYPRGCGDPKKANEPKDDFGAWRNDSGQNQDDWQQAGPKDYCFGVVLSQRVDELLPKDDCPDFSEKRC